MSESDGSGPTAPGLWPEWVCRHCGQGTEGGQRQFVGPTICADCYNELDYCPKCDMVYVPRHADRHDCQQALAEFAEYMKEQTTLEQAAAARQKRRQAQANRPDGGPLPF